MNRTVVAVVLVGFALGCGGTKEDPVIPASGNAGACFHRDTSPDKANVCTNFVGKDYFPEAVKLSCQNDPGNTYYADDCPGGAVGICHMKVGEPNEIYVHEYKAASDGSTTAQKKNCEVNDGVWK